MNTELKVVTYNIHDGRKLPILIQNIKGFFEQGVAVVCIQEVRSLFKGVKIAEVISEALPGILSEYFLGTEQDWYDYSLGILWNPNVLENISFAKPELPALEKAVLWEKMFFRMHGVKVHTLKRGALVGAFKVNGKILRITNTHLDFQGGWQQREKQLKALKSYLDLQSPADLEIICGDFNTLGFSSRVGKLSSVQNILTGFTNEIPAPYVTLPPVQQLDYIFTKGFISAAGEVLKLKGSDHWPIFSTLKI